MGPADVVSASDKKRLSEDETTYILNDTLLPEHREDVNVLNFIRNYLRCRHARQAAVEAGLDPRSGPNLLQRPDIHRCVEAMTARAVVKYGFTADEVVERVKEIANVDPLDVYDENGALKAISDIPVEVRRTIKKIEKKELYENDPNGMKVLVGYTTKIEFYDKMEAHKMMGPEKNVFKPKSVVEHDVGDNMAALLLESSRMGEAHIKAIDVTPVRALPAPEAK